MRMLFLDGGARDVSAIESALGARTVEIRRPSEALLGWPDDRRYAFGRWLLDPATREVVSAEGTRADLTASEFDLLLAFVRAPGRSLSREELVRKLRGRAWTYFDRSIDTLVARLRKKIGDRSEAPLIRSVRGVGYVFCARVGDLDAPSLG